MPGGAGQLRGVRELADARAALEFEIPVAELRDVPREVSAGDARVHVSMQFGREQGWAAVRLRLRARLQLTCQRCMGPLLLEIDERSRLVLIESESEADRVPADAETFLAAEGRLDLSAMASEELRLALPLVPRHARGGECAPGTADARMTDAAFGAPASRPFAGLRGLMKRSAKP